MLSAVKVILPTISLRAQQGREAISVGCEHTALRRLWEGETNKTHRLVFSKRRPFVEIPDIWPSASFDHLGTARHACASPIARSKAPVTPLLFFVAQAICLGSMKTQGREPWKMPLPPLPPQKKKQSMTYTGLAWDRVRTDLNCQLASFWLSTRKKWAAPLLKSVLWEKWLRIQFKLLDPLILDKPKCTNIGLSCNVPCNGYA